MTDREKPEDGPALDFTVRTKQDLIDAVERFGFMPLFANRLPGFSVEEHAVPEVWFSDEAEGVWEWKSFFEQNGGTYTQVGDVLLPNFVIVGAEQRPIGLSVKSIY